MNTQLTVDIIEAAKAWRTAYLHYDSSRRLDLGHRSISEPGILAGDREDLRRAERVLDSAVARLVTAEAEVAAAARLRA